MTRPRTRGECAGVPRPCPFVSCRHHLLLEVEERSDRRSLLWIVGGEGPVREDAELPEGWEDAAVERLRVMPHSCALDAAEFGAMSGEEVASALSITRSRVHQIVQASVGTLAQRASLRVLR